MPARLCVHLPDEAALVRILEDGARVTLGRETDCDVVVPHASVSRRHAELTNDAIGWHVVDLGSKNGLRFEGERVQRHDLGKHNWFAVGDVYCELEVMQEADRQAFEQRAETKRHASRAWAERVAAADSGAQMLSKTLEAVVALTECRRGFLLVGDGNGELKLRACYNLAPDELDDRGFQGSRSAVERALRERRIVLMSTGSDQAWLRQQASVVAQGLRAVVCLPLEKDGNLLGAVYADSDSSVHVFTQLDMELLEAFSARASHALELANIDGRLAEVMNWMALEADGIRDGGSAPPRWLNEA